MRINELIESNNQLDELNLRGVGQGIANAVGKTSNAVGAVAGGAAGAWDAAKAGFQAGRQAVGGQYTGSKTTPPAANTQTPPATGTTPASGTQPTTTTSAPSAQSAAPAGTAPTAATQPAGTPAQTPAAPTKIGAPVGKQAIDQAVATVKSVRSDRRPQVVAYGKKQFDALAQQPPAAPAQKPAAPAPEENPNIIPGYNESLDRLLYLSKGRK